MGIETADFNFMAETQIKVEDETTESSHLLPKTQKLSSETKNCLSLFLFSLLNHQSLKGERPKAPSALAPSTLPMGVRYSTS